MNARPFSARTLAHLAVVLAERSRAEANQDRRRGDRRRGAARGSGIVTEVGTVLASAGLAG